MDITLDYYNKNANSFYLTTKDVDFHVVQDKFLSYLHKKAQILDFGCGSGRDTKYFLDKGYNVEAWDGSKELCKLASEYTGIQVQNKMFFELEAVSEYDGIWACSSILHLPVDELENVLHKMSMALKVDGIIYTSFKYGDFSGWRNGRYFTDMTEEGFTDVIQNKNVTILEKWITGDVRPNRGDEKWLNLLLKKK
jgi:SAM-dependent methyltransferase